MNKRSFLMALGCLLTGAGTAEARGRKNETCEAPRGRRAYRQQLIGSPLEQENIEATRRNMHRYADLDDIQRGVDNAALWPVKDTEAYALDVSFAEYDKPNRQMYAHGRRQVLDFLDCVLGDGYATWKAQLINPDGTQDRFRINSLLRTPAYQKLIRRARNPYAADGRTENRRSTHFTGATVDINTGNLPLYTVRQWLRVLLADLEREGLILARSEGHGCLHVLVLPEFTPASYARAKERIARRNALAVQLCQERREAREFADSGLPF